MEVMKMTLSCQQEARRARDSEEQQKHADFIATWYDRPSIKHAFEAIGKVRTCQAHGARRRGN
eukprot:523263-Hanusia_phi.AAC.2